MNDESTQIPDKLPPGEVVEWLRHDSWTRDDAMLILMAINPDRTATIERQTEYVRPEWVFGADGPSMMAGYDQTPPRAEIRRLEERLTAMMDTWNSGNHPRLCTPAYYIKWAVNHGFEVSWLEAAHSTGLIDAFDLEVLSNADQSVGEGGGGASTVIWTPENRERLRKEHAELKRQMHKSPTKELAKRYGVTDSYIRRMKAQGKGQTPTKNSTWFAPMASRKNK